MKLFVTALAVLVATQSPQADAFQSPATTSNLFRRSASPPASSPPVYSQADDTSASSSSALLDDVDGVGAVAVATPDTGAANATETLKEDVLQLLVDVEEEATKATEEIMNEMDEEDCAIDPETGGAADEVCTEGFRAKLKSTIRNTLKLVRGVQETEDSEAVEGDKDQPPKEAGDLLEDGWSQRGGASAIRRNAEVWKFALKSVFRALKPRSMRKKGASDEEIEAAQIEAAEFIRDGLLTLGPTFVKLGQVRAIFCNKIVLHPNRNQGLQSVVFASGCFHQNRCSAKDLH